LSKLAERLILFLLELSVNERHKNIAVNPAAVTNPGI